MDDVYRNGNKKSLFHSTLKKTLEKNKVRDPQSQDQRPLSANHTSFDYFSIFHGYMSTTDQDAFVWTDFFIYVFVVPVSLILTSIGFCIVYRLWFDKPILGEEPKDNRRTDPGSPQSRTSGRSSGGSVYSLSPERQQPAQRLASWDV